MTDTDQSTRALIQEIARATAGEILDALLRADRPVATEYLTAQQVAQMTGFTLKALESRRSRREDPRFRKIGTSVRYLAADVRAWIEGGAT